MDRVESDSSELKPKFETKAGSTRCTDRDNAKFETICRTKGAEIYTRDLLGVGMVVPNYYQVKMAGLSGQCWSRYSVVIGAVSQGHISV